MKGFKQRLLGVALVVAMVLSMVPAAFAAETTVDSVDALRAALTTV